MHQDMDQRPRVVVHRGDSTRSEQRSMSIQVNSGDDAVEHTFEQPFLFSDITLEVEEKHLHAHRAILSMWSPVFKAMFSNEFKESKTSVIPLPHDSLEDFEEFLRFMYTPGGREMDVEVAMRLLPTVHRYQVDILMRVIENRLIASLAESNVLEYLRIANIYDIRNLKAASIERLSRIETEFLNNELDSQKIPKDIQLLIYKKRVMKLEEAITDIRKSFLQPCMRVESRMERRPANHCGDHQSPLFVSEEGDPCAKCVETFKGHILELCRRALNKHVGSATKDAAT